MVFDHLVKHNGVYYPAGTDVPADVLSERQAESADYIEDFFKNTETSPANSPIKDKAEKPSYTKSALHAMTTAELQNLASKCGVEGAKEKTGTELKKILAEMLVQ